MSEKLLSIGDVTDLPEYTAGQVEQHCTHEDLWIIFGGKVYNMTPYYKSHPGGAAMLRRAGKDATMQIHTIASHTHVWSFIEKKLKECLIGVVKKH